MSGLDPLGRRDIRELILSLRDRGCTVFFSSHVLSDAESLCSRVAILAGGRLAAEGPLTDLLAFRPRGWELVVTGLKDAVLEQATSRGHVTGATRLGDGRFALAVPASAAPPQVIAELTACGAEVVSLNPVRDTLEDLFVRQVATATRARGLEVVPR